MLATMLVHVGLLRPSWAYVELMLGQERRVHLSLSTKAQMDTPFWVMSRACWAYVGPFGPSMLGSWGPRWGHLGPMLSLCWAKNGVFI